MESETAVAAVGHAIQLSVGPVFLLTAIGALLGVMTNRLARTVDRTRATEARLEGSSPEELSQHHTSLATLSRRAKLINRAITLSTITALLVCGVIVSLFVGVFFRFESALTVAAFFTTAMGTLIAALIYFLREIFIATAALRIGPGGGGRPGGAAPPGSRR